MLLVQAVIGCSGQSPEQGNAAASANDAADAPAKRDDGKLVVAFGDSLYAGYGLADGEGFAPVLERSLTRRGVAARVVNAGVSGDTTAEGLNRLAFVLDGLARKPDLVIVGLGGNDMLRGLDPATTRANLEAILAELDKRGIPAMLTGMMAAPNMGADYGASFNAIYTDLAKSHEAPLYPFFLDGALGKRELMLPDGIHPNADGVALVTERVAPMVVERLEQLGPQPASP